MVLIGLVTCEVVLTSKYYSKLKKKIIENVKRNKQWGYHNLNFSLYVISWSHDFQQCFILTQNTVLSSQYFPILTVVMVVLL